MRSLLILIGTSALVGVAFGAALGYYQARPWAVVEKLSVDSPAAKKKPTEAAGRPSAEFPELVFNFGKMERGSTMQHAFEVRNVGEKPLSLAVASTTCKCTVGDLENNKLNPGEETQVLLEWAAKTNAGPFRHGATLATNDPENSSVVLTVEGEVVESTSVIPNELLFGNVSTGDAGEAQLYLISNIQDSVEVIDYEFSSPKIAERIELDIAPVGEDEMPVPDAKAAVKVTAKYQSDDSLGRFFGWLELKTNLEKAPKLSVLVAGNTIGDITVFGRGWSADQGLLRMGSISSSKGKTVRLNLSTRGEFAKSTEIEVASTDPPQLKATLGERKVIGEQLVHVPLLVEIPPGTKPIVRLGEPASSDAEIVLRTNHPKVSEVKLRVQFSVEP